MKIVHEIERLKRSELKNLVDARMKEFKKNRKQAFNELCFCLLTANFNAERSIEMQRRMGDGFCNLPENTLAKKLKELGHRYPNARANYIVEAKRHQLTEMNGKTEEEAREWLVKNVKGLGMKEASHFLRNIGYKNLAIIDFHILDLLVREKIIEKPKTLTKKKYLEIEDELRTIANQSRLTLAELDLYLWYMETGKVLK